MLKVCSYSPYCYYSEIRLVLIYLQLFRDSSAMTFKYRFTRYPFYKFLGAVIFYFGFLGTSSAQTIPVGMPFFDDALRRAQLMGQVDENVSFMIRPVHPQLALKRSWTWDKDSLFFPTDTNQYGQYTSYTYKKKKIRVELLPVYLHTRYNGHHPYGWADGSMVPSKGFQRFFSGGVYARAGLLEVQFRPEWVNAQNKPYQNPPFRSESIDNPDRMGQGAYRRRFLGQSYVKINVLKYTVGYSTENIWWGAGQKNAIVMSNNAPGFGHFTIHTNQPLKTRWGTIEGQMVGGKLKPSGFKYPTRYVGGTWPPIAGDVVVDSAAPEYYGYFNGMMGTFQPKWLPGLFLGVTRIVQSTGTPESFKSYFTLLGLSANGENTGSGSATGVNRNQIVSVSMRYLFVKSHAEFYGELGREDWAWDFEDFMTRPAATTAWMVGFRKLQEASKKGALFQIMTEVTKIQAPMDSYTQQSSTPGYSFYTNGGVRHGWTNSGQVLGAGIGPGSNMFTTGVTYIDGLKTTGVHFERVAYNEDLFWSRIDYLHLGGPNPFFRDFSKHYVDWGFLLSRHTTYGKLFVGYNLHILRTYNFQWNYDPNGKAGDFRFPGINVWSLNGEVSAVYRF